MSKSTPTIKIESLTYGPHGVGRRAGKALFVRGVVPGEEVVFEVREDRGTYAYADAIEIRKPAPDRREPPCRYLPRCGGCSWQHLAYPAQIAAKADDLRESLRRIASITDVHPRPVLPSPAEFGYRGRLSLRVDAGEVGFFAAATHDLVPIDHCLLALPEVDAGIAVARSLAGALRSNLRRIEVMPRAEGPGVVLDGEVEGALEADDANRLESWLLATPSAAGVSLHGKRWRQVWGDDRSRMSPEEGMSLTVRSGGFTQVNPAANLVLVATVLELGEFHAEESVLDLYAGAGNLTLPIARRVRRVRAVEQDAGAVADARTNISTAGLSNVEMVAGSVHRVLRGGRDRQIYFDAVVLDPPRSGAEEAIDDLLDLAPHKLLYVSCNPATLARDLARLKAKYRVDVVQPIDLFPQTYHLETVVRATRR